MKQLLLVFLGGGFGSVLRFFISKILNPLSPNFYYGTFLVNGLGCLLIGLLLGYSLRDNILSDASLLFLVAGFCGGFTTFSAFAFEYHSLLKNGQYLDFGLYTLASLLVGLAAVALGLWAAKSL